LSTVTTTAAAAAAAATTTTTTTTAAAAAAMIQVYNSFICVFLNQTSLLHVVLFKVYYMFTFFFSTFTDEIFSCGNFHTLLELSFTFLYTTLLFTMLNMCSVGLRSQRYSNQNGMPMSSEKGISSSLFLIIISGSSDFIILSSEGDFMLV
jgi:hypothetical protein